MTLMRSSSWPRLLVALLAGYGLFGAAPARAADPSALWEIVHGQCVPAAAKGQGTGPCRYVDLQQGYAVLKDIRGTTQFLLIPTVRTSGIEDPRILRPGAPNYWEAAWEARRFLMERAPHPVARQDVALAINSKQARSQDQLHIHVDCVRKDVLQALEARQARIGSRWSHLDVPLAGHHYLARRLEAGDLKGQDPFTLLAGEVPAANADMGDQTLVVVGAVFDGQRQGFILLNDHVDPAAADFAHGEDLQDHDCLVLAAPQ